MCAYVISSLIIPYQELLGNYDHEKSNQHDACIIPYQELLGNYDINLYNRDYYRDYTIPRAIRELWRKNIEGAGTAGLYHTKSY